MQVLVVRRDETWWVEVDGEPVTVHESEDEAHEAASLLTRIMGPLEAPEGKRAKG
jgi:hypothetical protein